MQGRVGKQGDKGRGRGAAKHEKHVRHTCFSYPEGGESAGGGGEAAQHEERAHMGMLSIRKRPPIFEDYQ